MNIGPRIGNLTFDPNDLDLSKNEALKSNSGVNLHPPTKFDEYRAKDLGRVGKLGNLTFDPDDLDLSKNEALKGNSGVNLHPPTKFDEYRAKDLGGVGEQTEKFDL